MEEARRKEEEKQRKADEIKREINEKYKKEEEARRAAKASQQASQQTQQSETQQQVPQQEANQKELVRITMGKDIKFHIKTGKQGETGPHNHLVINKGKPLESMIKFNKEFMIEAINSEDIFDGDLEKLDLNLSEEFIKRLDPVMVKFLKKLDETYKTGYTYLGEYIGYIATRGKMPMSFNVQYNLDELKKECGLFDKLLGKNKEQRAILENARKQAKILQHFEGNNITVYENQTFFDKVAKFFKGKEKVKALPVLPEEIRAFKNMEAYKYNNYVGKYNFREAIKGKDIRTMSKSKRKDKEPIKSAQFEKKVIEKKEMTNLEKTLRNYNVSPKIQDARFNTKVIEKKEMTNLEKTLRNYNVGPKIQDARFNTKVAEEKAEEVERLVTTGVIDADEREEEGR